ncbi:ribonuclease D [bacterium BMS3Bbin06]|nr:ribonuclease D [bacterium BMS3Abin08]GBE35797.1 ribonuclease D [bacterium BMS3Bbin06]
MSYINIENEAGLRSYLKRFNEKELHIIALDIEAESNCHAYGEKLCLTQIFDGVNHVIIDPFNIGSNALKLLFENPNVLKIMYDAGSDLSLLKNSAGIEIKSILDLRPAVELLNYKKKDLHSVIASELGIILEKKRTYQQYNWMKRPVSEQAIDYALNDVRHLPALKDIILAKLYARKLMEIFLLKNLQIQNKDYTRDPEDKYKKISGYSRLQDDQKENFRKVFDIRDKYAKQCDLPPHNVIQKTDIIRIIQDAKYIDHIRYSKRLSKDLVQDMLQEIRKAAKSLSTGRQGAEAGLNKSSP